MTARSGSADGISRVGHAGMQTLKTRLQTSQLSLGKRSKPSFSGEISVTAKRDSEVSKMSRKRNIVIATIAFLVLSLFMFWPSNSGPRQAAQETMTWPDDWDAMNLPRIPDATITRIGGVRDQRGGVSIDLDADWSLKEITDLIEEQFAKLDYFAYRPDANENSYYNEFSSDDKDVSVDAKPNPEDPAKSKVTIVVHYGQVTRVKTFKSTTRVD